MRTVLVTRAAADAGPLCEALAAAGLRPVRVPLLERRLCVQAVAAAARRPVDGWVLTSAAAVDALAAAGASLVFAGAVGNLYDNFVRADRSVRDFLHFSGDWPWQWDFPAFNIADSCITVGAFGLFVLLWREDSLGTGSPNKATPDKANSDKANSDKNQAKGTPANDAKVS